MQPCSSLGKSAKLLCSITLSLTMKRQLTLRQSHLVKIYSTFPSQKLKTQENILSGLLCEVKSVMMRQSPPALNWTGPFGLLQRCRPGNTYPLRCGERSAQGRTETPGHHDRKPDYTRDEEDNEWHCAGSVLISQKSMYLKDLKCYGMKKPSVERCHSHI